jgi:hypothetical protein
MIRFKKKKLQYDRASGRFRMIKLQERSRNIKIQEDKASEK